jgi:cytochrome d ubiquinol oxidase subunit II
MRGAEATRGREIAAVGFEYHELKLAWWIFGVGLFVWFALRAGVGIGIAAILPVIGRSEPERSRVIAAVAPARIEASTGFLLACGATVVAWPGPAEVAFGALSAMLVAGALALTMRPLGFKLRGKLTDARWRARCDLAVSAGAVATSLTIGLHVGSLLEGVPFRFDGVLRANCSCGDTALPVPFALLTGMLFLAMLLMHGSAHLLPGTEGAVRARTRVVMRAASIATVVSFVVAGLWAAMLLPGYRVTYLPAADQLQSIGAKIVTRAPGAWLANFNEHPWMWIAPLAGVAGAATAFALRSRGARLGSMLSLAGIVVTLAFSMFPFIIPSATDPASSLTVWDAASSRQALFTMFWAFALLMPAWVGFAAWADSDTRNRV